MRQTANPWIIHSNDLNSAENRRLALWSATGLLLAYLVMLAVPIKATDIIHVLLTEDGVFESLTALCFAIASVVFGLVWWRQRNIYMLLFAIVFLVGAGEEISWGQRILDFDTPELLLEHNTQREFNFHNIVSKHNNPDRWMPTVGQLFNLFWLGYCVLIPFAAYASARIDHLAAAFRLPIVNPWIGIFFLINYLVAKLLHAILPTEQLDAVEYYVEVT